jgi:ribonuclease R
VVQVTGTDPEGDAIARPVGWAGNGPPPMILMAPEPRGQPALAPGQRVLARLRPIPGSPGPGRYEGRSIRRVDDAPGRILGVFRPGKPGPGKLEPGGPEPGKPGAGSRVAGSAQTTRREGRIIPTDRRAKAEWLVPPGEDGGALAGEIVLAEPMPHDRLGLKPARVIERLGNMGDARSISLIAIHTHDIPQTFPVAALAEAERARPAPLGQRTDLRHLKLVTIDGEDARDFDDAVFAEALESPGAGGFRLIVAIADVAHYVRPGSALDDAARTRGNSVYFPDRVVPMLPEALSNDLCSLRPGEDRPCLFAEMTVDAGGRKTAHRFGRGLMRSAARLTYEEVQRAHDAHDRAALGDHALGDQADPGRGAADAPDLPLAPLYAAFRALLAARTARGTLDLDLPERQVKLDAVGHVTAVLPRPRLDSHRLIEEFMVLANVAAAEELERRHQPAMYRVHAPPSEEKLAALRAFLGGMSISLPPGNQLRPRDLDRVLRGVAGTDAAPLINEVMLRSQSQAAYSPDNIGHFGLALPRYVHFTSPIRRYADLLVHRALIAGLELGADGLSAEEAAHFLAIAEQITATERRAQLAEREAIDRYLAAFMADKVGAHFAARISGVTRFGIFVTLADSGASGLLPMSALPNDYWQHDEATQTLTGRHTRQVFSLAQPIEVRLAEASQLTGGLVFQYVPDRREAPHRTAPDRTAQDRTAHDRTAHDRTAHDRTGPGRAAPDGTAPGRATPGRRGAKRSRDR